MRLMTFEHDGKAKVGALDGELVIDLRATRPGVPASMRELLEGGAAAMALAAEALGAPERVEIRLADVRALAPVPNPGKILCIGVNYHSHAAESNVELPSHPMVFAKFTNAVIGPGEAIVIPASDEAIDYEAELGVVIGKTARRVRAEHAFEHVAGYLNFHDVSARELQMRTSQFLMGKSPDTFAPMGPVLVTRDEVPDVHALRVRTRLNGETLQDGTTSDMIFKIPRLIEDISSAITLEPGDIIATGTPEGIGFMRTPPIFMRPGDTVEIEIEGLGILSNPVVTMA